MFEADFVFPFIFCFGEALPPYVVAFFWSLALAYLSKRLNRRGFVMLCSSPFALAGYVTFVATDLSDIHARYVSLADQVTEEVNRTSTERVYIRLQPFCAFSELSHLDPFSWHGRQTIRLQSEEYCSFCAQSLLLFAARSAGLLVA